MDGGHGELVAEVRQAFQADEAGAFVDVVEEATGRKVQNFLSKHDPVDEVSVEVFILEPRREE